MRNPARRKPVGGRKGNPNMTSMGIVVGRAGTRGETRLYLCQELPSAAEPGTWARTGPGGSPPVHGHCDSL